MGNTVVWSCKRFDELSTDDLYAILQLRAEIFVVEQDCVYQDVDGFDQGALHVMGHLAAAEDAARHSSFVIRDCLRRELSTKVPR